MGNIILEKVVETSITAAVPLVMSFSVVIIDFAAGVFNIQEEEINSPLVEDLPNTSVE